MPLLEEKAKKDDKDASMQFLLGYEYHFTGKKNAAREQFEKTLKLEPDHAPAKLFLKQLDTPKADGDSKKSKSF